MNIVEQQKRYKFDATGFLLERNFLSKQENEEIVRLWPTMNFFQEDWHDHQTKENRIHEKYEAFRALQKRISKHSNTQLFISYPHRILESYAFARTAGDLDLHGGPAEHLVSGAARDASAHHWVMNDQIYTLRLKVLIYLDDVETVDDGAFMYVEGSHKSHFSFHEAFPDGRDSAPDLIRTLSIQAGDAIWLNEALMHGAHLKTGDLPRRIAAFTFGPTFMSDWQDIEPDAEKSGYVATETESRDEHK